MVCGLYNTGWKKCLTFPSIFASVLYQVVLKSSHPLNEGGVDFNSIFNKIKVDPILEWTSWEKHPTFGMYGMVAGSKDTHIYFV